MTHRVRRAVIGGALAAAAVAFACTHVSTDPNYVLALQLDPPVLPSIVQSDGLHDTTGALDSLHATAFNSQGDTVHGAPIKYLVVSGRKYAQVDSISGKMLGSDTVTGLAQVIAYVSGIQTRPQPVQVVYSPDLLSPVSATDTVVDYDQSTLKDLKLPLKVRLQHGTGTDSTVSPYRLTYAFVPPTNNTNSNPSQVQIVNAALRPQLVDTTKSGGLSTLQLLATLVTAKGHETVYIDVSARKPDGSPVADTVRFAIDLTIH